MQARCAKVLPQRLPQTPQKGLARTLGKKKRKGPKTLENKGSNCICKPSTQLTRTLARTLARTLTLTGRLLVRRRRPMGPAALAHAHQGHRAAAQDQGLPRALRGEGRRAPLLHHGHLSTLGLYTAS